jgi:hypothetical protein
VSAVVKLGLVLGLTVVGALWADRAPALSVRAMSPAEVAENAALVVIARVEHLHTRTEASGAVVEHLRLHVHETWKGRVVETWPLRQWRGHAGTAGTRTVPGLPLLEAGKTYLLFLPAPTERPALPIVVGGEQGVFEAQATPDGWRFTDRAGRAVVGLADGTLLYETPNVSSAPVMRPGAGAVLTTSSPKPALPATTPAQVAQAWRNLVVETGP